MNMDNATDKMLYFGVSEYLFNTAGFAYHSAGALNYLITNNLASLLVLKIVMISWLDTTWITDLQHYGAHKRAAVTYACKSNAGIMIITCESMYHTSHLQCHN